MLSTEALEELKAVFEKHDIPFSKSEIQAEDEYEPDVDYLFEFLPKHGVNEINIDGECIEDEDAYGALLNSFASSSNGQLVLENLTSDYNDDSAIEVLQFECNDNSYKWEFSHEQDWIEGDFIEKVQALTKENTNGCFLHNQYADFVNLIFLPAEVGLVISKHYDLISC